MKSSWLLTGLLLILLAVTAVSIVASRLWITDSHRQLKDAEKQQFQLLEQEQALQLEWVARIDLNTVEQRAKNELGMIAPRSDQWQVMAP